LPSRKQIETFTKIVYKYANFRIIFLYFFMSQQKLLISTLKQALKQQGLTYAQVASQIHISEASVKRMFSSGRFTLERIEAICALMEMQLLDLMRLMERAQHSTSQLSWEQEEELIGDIRLLLLIALIRNHWSLPQILHDYAIPEHDCIQLLAQLDRLRLIELQPGNRIRLLVAPDFQWIPNGPIVRFYEERVKAEFFDASFSGQHSHRQFLSGELSAGSAALLIKKMRLLEQEFAELLKADLSLPPEQRINIGLVLAQRPWQFHAFDHLRREQES